MLYGLVLVGNLIFAYAMMRGLQLLYGVPKDTGFIKKIELPPAFIHSILAINVIPNYLFAYQFLKLAAHDDSLLFAAVLGACCMMPTLISALYGLLTYYKAAKSFWLIAQPIMHTIGISLVIIALMQYRPYS